jgi:hypothetical protein
MKENIECREKKKIKSDFEGLVVKYLKEDAK